MIIDGHAHTYPDHYAHKIVHSFLDLHHMETTVSVGAGTVSDLREKMRKHGISHTVLANFAPLKSLRSTNAWTLSMAQEFPDLIPLISVYPGMPADEVRAYTGNGQRASRCIPASRALNRMIPAWKKSMPSAICTESRSLSTPARHPGYI